MHSALIVQIIGAASGANESSFNQRVLNGKLYLNGDKLLADILLGIHVYMGGVGFQQLSIFVFSFFAIKFNRTILQQMREGVEDVSSALPLLYAIYAVLILITVC